MEHVAHEVGGRGEVVLGGQGRGAVRVGLRVGVAREVVVRMVVMGHGVEVGVRVVGGCSGQYDAVRRPEYLPSSPGSLRTTIPPCRHLGTWGLDALQGE